MLGGPLNTGIGGEAAEAEAYGGVELCRERESAGGRDAGNTVLDWRKQIGYNRIPNLWQAVVIISRCRSCSQISVNDRR